MDSEMSTCCCFLLRQLLLVQKTAHARGAVREPRGMVIGSLLRNGVGHRFFNFLCTPCSFKMLFFWRHLSPTWIPNDVFWELFFRKLVTTKKCVSTGPARTDCIWAHPMERPGRPKNQRKNISYFRTSFLNEETRKHVKQESQKVSKWVTLFRGWRLFGDACSTFGAPSRFLIPKMTPQHRQSASRDQKLFQKWPEGAENDPNNAKNDSESVSEKNISWRTLT